MPAQAPKVTPAVLSNALKANCRYKQYELDEEAGVD